MQTRGGVSSVEGGRNEGKRKVYPKLVCCSPDSAEQAEENNVTRGSPAAENCIVGSRGVGDHTQVCEFPEPRLPNAMKNAVNFSLVLAANPGRAPHRSEATGVVVGPNTKSGRFWGGIHEDRRESERMWWLCGARGELDKEEALQERLPETEGKKARERTALDKVVQWGQKYSHLGGWAREPL